MVFGLPAWNYFSKANFYQRHRTLFMYIIVAMTTVNLASKYKTRSKNEFIKGSLHYTTDDSDFEFRNTSNLTDYVVKNKLIDKYSEKVMAERVALEREMQLEAYNHLYGTSLKNE
ncbi:unnamed protein product [Moneuplotes crassus]|uniref:Uncharacterized protein n=1 Tax=Euplotes crassus TaxID=5936 RepID=A0A7S3KPY1_EUPCR|nr:unnamed protein product [Moneuplotes crassus]|mmetsp:Transcript_35516/g.35171  ORF Transcript_35516/g.35171 Transcript_35516/m.35171 type:complete len:115 (+) Transcript_35516:8-352(+)